MSYFEDYVQDGLCCEGCGEFMGGDEPGFVRRCAGCALPKLTKRRVARKRRS